MRHRLPILTASLLLAALSPLGATVFRPGDVVNLPGAPFEISAAQASTPARSSSGLFAFELRARNIGPRVLTRIGVEAVVFSPLGDPRGFYEFQIETNLKPGVATYLGYGTSQAGPGKTPIAVEGGDRIVLMPYAAKGPGTRWQAAASALAEAREALKAAEGDASKVELRGAPSAQNQTAPADPAADETCAVSQSTYSRCEATCQCGVSSVSFNCTENSQACGCFPCPAAPR